MEILQIILILFPAVILHECAHGWVAWRLGDSTAKLAGRLTLNPLKHVDPLGTVILPGLLFLLRSDFFIGWAKPVPVNFMNLRHPRRDMMLVALAGPATNIALALAASALLKINSSSVVAHWLSQAIVINLLLAIFNLIPIPPLDGSRLVLALLPKTLAYLYAQMEEYGLLIVVILLSLGLFKAFILPLVFLLAYYFGVRWGG